MTIRVGINGFGRMGRLILRAGWGSPDIEFVHINDPFVNAHSAAHLLEFDSVHGRWQGDIRAENGSLHIEAKPLTLSDKRTPAEVAWPAQEVDIVLECSGQFRTMDILQPYLDQGVVKVIVSAPVKEGVFNIVMGCNDHLYDPQAHHIITAASCTT